MSITRRRTPCFSRTQKPITQSFPYLSLVEDYDRPAAGLDTDEPALAFLPVARALAVMLILIGIGLAGTCVIPYKSKEGDPWKQALSTPPAVASTTLAVGEPPSATCILSKPSRHQVARQ